MTLFCLRDRSTKGLGHRTGVPGTQVHWDSGPHVLLPAWAQPGPWHTEAPRRRARGVAVASSSYVAPEALLSVSRGPEQRLAPQGPALAPS